MIFCFCCSVKLVQSIISDLVLSQETQTSSSFKQQSLVQGDSTIQSNISVYSARSSAKTHTIVIMIEYIIQDIRSPPAIIDSTHLDQPKIGSIGLDVIFTTSLLILRLLKSSST